MILAGQARAARKRYREMTPVLNEQSRRRFVALEARALGRGGVSLMARISGLARSTIYHGLSDIRDQTSVTFCAAWAIACRRTARHEKAASTSIATRNFITSIRRPKHFWRRTNRSFRLIQKEGIG